MFLWLCLSESTQILKLYMTENDCKKNDNSVSEVLVCPAEGSQKLFKTCIHMPDTTTLHKPSPTSIHT